MTRITAVPADTAWSTDDAALAKTILAIPDLSGEVLESQRILSLARASAAEEQAAQTQDPRLRYEAALIVDIEARLRWQHLLPHPAITPEILEAMSLDPIIEIRRAVAAVPATPVDALEFLIEVEESLVHLDGKPCEFVHGTQVMDCQHEVLHADVVAAARANLQARR